MAEPEQFDKPMYRKDRREEVPDEDGRSVTFAAKKLSPERLQALRAFLRQASPDDIAMLRDNYADVPEVMHMIALELGKEPF